MSATIRMHCPHAQNTDRICIGHPTQRVEGFPQLRGFSPRTQQSYARAVRKLAEHYHKSPDLATEEELRQYFLFRKNVSGWSRVACTIALCGIKFFSYHSCKNRHCPKCQNDQADRWLAQQQESLLPLPYFMVTFTLPAESRALARSHQKVIYDLLFQASHEALQMLAADPKYIGGTLGMIGVPQTWTRDLRYHPHIHYLIPGGGLAPDGQTWLPARPDYLLPAKPLAQIFRAKFRDLLKLSKSNVHPAVPALPAKPRRPQQVHPLRAQRRSSAPAVTAR